MLSFYVSIDSTYNAMSKNSKQDQTLTGISRLEKYFNIEGFLENSIKIKSALKSTEKSLHQLPLILASLLQVDLINIAYLTACAFIRS